VKGTTPLHQLTSGGRSDLISREFPCAQVSSPQKMETEGKSSQARPSGADILGVLGGPSPQPLCVPPSLSPAGVPPPTRRGSPSQRHAIHGPSPPRRHRARQPHLPQPRCSLPAGRIPILARAADPFVAAGTRRVSAARLGLPQTKLSRNSNQDSPVRISYAQPGSRDVTGHDASLSLERRAALKTLGRLRLGRGAPKPGRQWQ
jgi:hypothetical protein